MLLQGEEGLGMGGRPGDRDEVVPCGQNISIGLSV
jgi:hypothetical protein